MKMLKKVVGVAFAVFCANGTSAMQDECHTPEDQIIHTDKINDAADNGDQRAKEVIKLMTLPTTKLTTEFAAALYAYSKNKSSNKNNPDNNN